jgi:carboxynorspermidine decarboxylase
MVKTTMFNGIQHPHLCTFEPTTGDLAVVRSFAYEDYRDRLS